MFGWLTHPDPLVRGLFSYHDGRKRRLADPLVASAALDKESGKEWENYLAVIDAVGRVPMSGRLAEVASAEQERAISELVRVTRVAFDLPPVDDAGRGLSGAEVLGVLARYIAFLGQLREKYGPLARLPARRAESPTASDTGEWSASGSTATRDAPTASPNSATA